MTTANQTTWTVGETCYQAWAELKGHPQDIDCQPRKTRDEAESDCETWLSWLSDNERKYAHAIVVRYRIDEIQEDGTIGSMSTYRGE